MQFADCVADCVLVMRGGCVTDRVSVIGCVAGWGGARSGCVVGAVKRLGVSLPKHR